MNISFGPYSADVDPIVVAGKRPLGYHVAVSRSGTLLYEQLEQDWEEAVQVALAYINWELDHYAEA
jgi:hypothetical protein